MIMVMVVQWQIQGYVTVAESKIQGKFVEIRWLFVLAIVYLFVLCSVLYFALHYIVAHEEEKNSQLLLVTDLNEKQGVHCPNGARGAKQVFTWAHTMNMHKMSVWF